MAYFVRPFALQSAPSGTVLFAAGGVHSLTSSPMQSVITELAHKQGGILDDPEVGAIVARHGVDQRAAIGFLKDDVGLLVSSPRAAEVSGDVLVLSDLPLMGSMLAECLALPNSCRVLVRREHDRAPAAPSCIVLAMGNYCEDRVRDVYAEYAARPGIALITAYLFRHLFVIDGPFIPSRGLPCHFCHRHHFGQGEGRRWSGSDGGWISAKQHLEQKGVAVPPDIPLTSAIEGMVALALKHEIEPLLAVGNPPRLGETVGTSLQIDLRTGERRRDKIFHWAACDCLQGGWA